MLVDDGLIETPHLNAFVSAASSSSTVVEVAPAASLADAKNSTLMEMVAIFSIRYRKGPRGSPD